jgi:hypothetical protein
MVVTIDASLAGAGDCVVIHDISDTPITLTTFILMVFIIIVSWVEMLWGSCHHVPAPRQAKPIERP